MDEVGSYLNQNVDTNVDDEIRMCFYNKDSTFIQNAYVLNISYDVVLTVKCYINLNKFYLIPIRRFV